MLPTDIGLPLFSKPANPASMRPGQPAYSDKAILLADQSSPSQQKHLLQQACFEKEHMPWGLVFTYAHKHSKMFRYSWTHYYLPLILPFPPPINYSLFLSLAASPKSSWMGLQGIIKYKLPLLMDAPYSRLHRKVSRWYWISRIVPFSWEQKGCA